MRFGASSWPFQWDPPYEDAIRRDRRPRLQGDRADRLERGLPRGLLDQVQDRRHEDGAEGRGHRPLAVRLDAARPVDADKAKRAAAVEQWKKAVEVGAELGSPIINMVSSHRLRHARHVRRSRASRPSRWCRNTPPRTCRAASTGTRTSRTMSTRCSACAEACEQGRRHDVGRAASGPLPRQPRRRLAAARACRSSGDGHQLRPEPHLPDGRLSRTSRSIGSASTSSTCTSPTMTASPTSIGGRAWARSTGSRCSRR